MAKFTPSLLTSLTNEQSAISTINNNLQALATALENTLSRDGTSPNSMNAGLDLNSNRILNLPNPIAQTEPLRLADLAAFIGAGTITTIPAGGTTGQVLAKTSNSDYAVAWTASGGGTVSDTSANATYYPLLSTATSGSLSAKVDSANFAFTEFTGGCYLEIGRASTVASGDNNFITLNGPTSGTGAGAFIQQDNGGLLVWLLGNYSAAFGGAYDATTTLGSTRGLRAVIGTGGTTPITNSLIGLWNSDAAGNVTGVVPAAGITTFLATPTSANLRAALTDEVGTGAAYFVGGALGTPASGTATNLTGLPVSTGISGLGANVASWLATPSSANLAAAITDETGSGALVFGTTPTISNPKLTNISSSVAGFIYVDGSGNLGTSTYVPAMYNAFYFGVNLNAAGDNAITVTLPNGYTRYVIDRIQISRASASLATATAGVFSAIGGGGVQIVATGALSAVTSSSENTNGNGTSLTLANPNTTFNQNTIYFRVGATQAATCDVNVFFRVLP